MMTDRVLLDTNIIIYAYITTDYEKHEKAKLFINGLRNSNVCISIQVLNETYSALMKNGINNDNTKYYINYCIKKYTVLDITISEIQTCLSLRDNYNYSYWDCLLLATAVNNACSFVYSEDMQNKHILHTGLSIINPLI
jgi:predicted nucleic acid-binding protein